MRTTYYFFNAAHKHVILLKISKSRFNMFKEVHNFEHKTGLIKDMGSYVEYYTNTFQQRFKTKQDVIKSFADQRLICDY